MTSKEKAIELVNKFYNIIYLDMDYEQAKYAALIAVDEIMLNEKINHSSLDKTYEYWEEVKNEIQKL